MEKTYLKWTNKEETLLLNFVIAKIEDGVKITEALKQFAHTYQIEEGRVSSKWQFVCAENKSYVEMAKMVWRTSIKPEREAEAKEKRKREKEEQKKLKQNKMIRERYRKQKARKAKRESKRVKVRIPLNQTVASQDKGLFVKVDANGVVQMVKSK